MSTFVSFGRLVEAFTEGQAPLRSLQHVIVDDQVFANPAMGWSNGAPQLTLTSDTGQLVFNWNASGAVFIPGTVEMTLNEVAPAIEEEAVSCPLPSTYGTVGPIRLAVEYDDVPSPQLHYVTESMIRVESHTPSVKLSFASGGSIYLYEDASTHELTIPTLILDDGSVLHNLRVTTLESSCPRIILPRPDLPS